MAKNTSDAKKGQDGVNYQTFRMPYERIVRCIWDVRDPRFYFQSLHLDGGFPVTIYRGTGIKILVRNNTSSPRGPFGVGIITSDDKVYKELLKNLRASRKEYREIKKLAREEDIDT
jgi:hypothetical protein